MNGLKNLQMPLGHLEAQVEGFTVEKLVQDEAFVSATIHATRIAIGTHQQAKHEYLRNALLNIALAKGPDEVLLEIFLNAIEAFTPAHVKALNVIWSGFGERNLWNEHGVPIQNRNYGTAIGIMVPELKGQSSLTQFMLADLRTRGFSSLSGTDAPFPQGGIITNMGITFLRFVLSPTALPK